MHRIAAISIVLAACDPVPDWHIGESVGLRVKVMVGETAGVDVTRTNNADDWSCDPSSLVAISFDVRHGTRYWSVTGVDTGTARCRIGNVHNDHLDVTVTIGPRS